MRHLLCTVKIFPCWAKCPFNALGLLNNALSALYNYSKIKGLWESFSAGGVNLRTIKNKQYPTQRISSPPQNVFFESAPEPEREGGISAHLSGGWEPERGRHCQWPLQCDFIWTCLHLCHLLMAWLEHWSWLSLCTTDNSRLTPPRGKLYWKPSHFASAIVYIGAPFSLFFWH